MHIGLALIVLSGWGFIVLLANYGTPCTIYYSIFINKILLSFFFLQKKSLN